MTGRQAITLHPRWEELADWIEDQPRGNKGLAELQVANILDCSPNTVHGALMRRRRRLADQARRQATLADRGLANVHHLLNRLDAAIANDPEHVVARARRAGVIEAVGELMRGATNNPILTNDQALDLLRRRAELVRAAGEPELVRGVDPDGGVR